jgi:hypothetical protein
LTEPLQEIFLRQRRLSLRLISHLFGWAKAQGKGSSHFSELGVLCVFARVICFRFGNSKTRRISNMLGYIYLNTMARKDGRFKLAETSQ